MTKLLVPFDGSRPALRAVRYAISLARDTGAVIHLINVHVSMDHYGMVGAYLKEETYRKYARESGNAALRPAVALLERAGVTHVAHLARGDIASEITRVARRLKCDAIIMGTRGLGAVGNLLLGSVATKVVHLSAAPVTLVK